MPHLTLEYTDNLTSFQPGPTLLALNQALMASKQFQEEDIKSRAIKLDSWCVGTASAGRAFVHVRMAILSGRSIEVKNELSHALLAELNAVFKETPAHRLQLCVEVLEIERATYAKTLVHP